MTTYYPIVLETETNGAVSAYVPGPPIYAAADTRAKAELGPGVTSETVSLDSADQSVASIANHVVEVDSGTRP